MAACVFLGDEVTGLGFRLAGVEVQRPSPHQLTACFVALRETSPLILLDSETAAALPPELLRETQVARWPLVLVVPDIRERTSAPDLVAEIRRQLGMAE
jgi:vacuolar-type H+-ATPase subunit F/Vma7